MYADGGGLYLQVTSSGASWIYRYMLNGRAREMELGPLALFGLHEARAKVLDARRLRHEGTDPIEARRAARMRELLDAAKKITFKQCAEAYIKAHSAGWRNAKHVAQWKATLTTYSEPIVGSLPVQVIDTALVMKILEQEAHAVSAVKARISLIIRHFLEYRSTYPQTDPQRCASTLESSNYVDCRDWPLLFAGRRNSV